MPTITIENRSHHGSRHSSLSTDGSAGTGVHLSPPSASGSQPYTLSDSEPHEPWTHLRYPHEVHSEDSASRPRSSHRHRTADVAENPPTTHRQSSHRRAARITHPTSPESVDSVEDYDGHYARTGPPPHRHTAYGYGPQTAYAPSSSEGFAPYPPVPSQQMIQAIPAQPYGYNQYHQTAPQAGYYGPQAMAAPIPYANHFSPPAALPYAPNAGYFPPYHQPQYPVPPAYYPPYPPPAPATAKVSTPPPSASPEETMKAMKELFEKQQAAMIERDKAKEAAEAEKLKKLAEEKAAAERRAAEDKKLQSDATAEAEKKATKALEDEKAKAAEELKKAKEAAEKELAEKVADAKKAPDGKKAPIKFKDAVGRKFQFPFHLCSTWDGMEELINQAFTHVEGLAQHVYEGRYDLSGPSGEIILRDCWESTIEPDWTITMHMWPTPEEKEEDLDDLLKGMFMDDGKRGKKGKKDKKGARLSVVSERKKKAGGSKGHGPIPVPPPAPSAPMSFDDGDLLFGENPHILDVSPVDGKGKKTAKRQSGLFTNWMSGGRPPPPKGKAKK